MTDEQQITDDQQMRDEQHEHARRMYMLEKLCEKGNRGALYEALQVCLAERTVLFDGPYIDGGVLVPQWVARNASACLADYLRNHLTTGTGRNAKWIKRYHQDLIDWFRFEMVEELQLLEVPWKDIYERSSRALLGTRAWGSPETIKKSYMKVKQDYRTSARYAVFEYIRMPLASGEEPTFRVGISPRFAPVTAR